MSLSQVHQHRSSKNRTCHESSCRKVLLVLASLSVFLVISEWKDLHELPTRYYDPTMWEGARLQLALCKVLVLITSLYALVLVLRLRQEQPTPEHQQTLIFDAASNGDVEALRTLLEAGTNVNIKSCDGRTPLHVASAEGHSDAIKFLLDKGATVNVLDRWGHSPLQETSHAGHVTAGALLRRWGGKALQKSATSARDLRLRACDAAAQGDLETVMMLVSQLASANSADYDGRSMLHLAAAEGHADVVLALCDANADVNCKDRWGGTPLRDAIRGGHQSVIEVLVASGAELDKSPDESALKMCILASSGDVEGIRCLVFNGVSVDSQDYNQRSALHLASVDGREEATKLLLELKADVSKVDRWGGTAVDDAIAAGHEQVVELLKAAGAKPTRTEEDADLALRLCDAACRGSAQQVATLIKRVGVNASDYDKRSALHLAAAEGHIDVVELLLEQRANPRSKDRWGSTPLKDALRGGHQHVVEVLLVAQGDSSARQLIRTRSIVDAYFAAELDAISRRKKAGRLQSQGGSFRDVLADEVGKRGNGHHGAGKMDWKAVSRGALMQGSTHDALEGMRKRILQGGAVTESFKMKKGLMFTDAAHLVSKT